jgi:bifunctional non-homologous end joining protein LigD
VRRDELGPAMTSDRYTIENLGRRLAALRADPWAGFEEAAVTITRRMRAAVGLKT